MALVVLVTCPSQRHARRLARTLVRGRLAACVNVVPAVASVFWWRGKVEQARESLLIIKTPERRFEPLRRAILAGHPYDVPEVIAVRVTRGHPPYLRWVRESTTVHRGGPSTRR